MKKYKIKKIKPTVSGQIQLEEINLQALRHHSHALDKKLLTEQGAEIIRKQVFSTKIYRIDVLY